MLLHGGGQGSWVWDETKAVLEAQDAKVLTLDVPGCGQKRGIDSIGYGVNETVEELISDIKAAGLSDIILVGHSQAGTMLPILWRSSPALVRHLLYLSACAPLPGQSVVDMMGRGLHGQFVDQVGWPLDPETTSTDEMRRLTFFNDMSAAQATAMRKILDLDHWPLGVTYATDWDYAGLDACPSAYVICDRDGILPPHWQVRFAERLRCKEQLHIDVGHQAMNTQPEALVKLLMAKATKG
ncbi:MAG: alpha/beta fold hydrolase [Sphingorhabdus sp.]